MTLPRYIRSSLSVGMIGAMLLAAYFWDREERGRSDVRQYVVQEDESVTRQSPQLETASVEIPGTAKEPKSYLVQATSLEIAASSIATYVARFPSR